VETLPDITREYLTLGKCIVHNTFDNTNYLWKDIIMQNPDYVECISMPLFSKEPFMSLIPDPQLKSIAKSRDPRVRQLFNNIPKNVLSKIVTGQKIPLSNENTTYLHRKISGYDTTGTSLMSRLYKVIMYEDAIYNASIAVAQRNAAPLRLFKLGDANSGWVPTPEQEQQFIDMLMQAEADPYAALVYHYGIEVDYIGVSDKLLGISREWDFISQVKFMALGMSRELISGESSYSSMQGSIQVMTERLRTLRQKIEQSYIIEKFFKPIARVHKFYKRSTAEIKHNIRVSGKDNDENLILPNLKWYKVLDSTKDSGLLSLWGELMDKGACSLRTYSAGAGVDLDEERKNIMEEVQWNKENAAAMGQSEEESNDEYNRFAKIKKANKKDNILSNLTRLNQLKKKSGGSQVPSDVFDTKIWDKKGNYENVHYSDIEDAARIALKNDLDWDDIDHLLVSEGLSNRKIKVAREIFENEGIIQPEYSKNKNLQKSSAKRMGQFLDKKGNDNPDKLKNNFLSGK